MKWRVVFTDSDDFLVSGDQYQTCWSVLSPTWPLFQVYGGKESKYIEFLEPKLLTMGPVQDVETGVREGEDLG